MIEHPAWRTDDNLRPTFQSFDLGRVTHAAIDCHTAQSGWIEQQVGLLCDLVSQLARGYKNERLGVSASGIKTFEHGQQVGTGLAATGTCLDHHIASFQEVGNAARLHRHQLGPASPIYRLAQVFWQICQVHFWQRAVPGLFRGFDCIYQGVLTFLLFDKWPVQ